MRRGEWQSGQRDHRGRDRPRLPPVTQPRYLVDVEGVEGQARRHDHCRHAHRIRITAGVPALCRRGSTVRSAGADNAARVDSARGRAARPHRRDSLRGRGRDCGPASAGSGRRLPGEPAYHCALCRRAAPADGRYRRRVLAGGRCRRTAVRARPPAGLPIVDGEPTSRSPRSRAAPSSPSAASR